MAYVDGRQVQITNTATGDSRFVDATISTTHSSRVTITKFPVERGMNVADHKRVEPAVVSLECFWSNAPAVPVDFLPDQFEKRAEDAYAFLLACMSSTGLLEVNTPLRLYTEMAITSLTAPVTVANGDGLTCSLVLEQIRVVDNKTVRVVTSQPNGQPKGEKGKVATKLIEAPPKLTSSLSELTGIR